MLVVGDREGVMLVSYDMKGIFIVIALGMIKMMLVFRQRFSLRGGSLLICFDIYAKNMSPPKEHKHQYVVPQAR